LNTLLENIIVSPVDILPILRSVMLKGSMCHFCVAGVVDCRYAYNYWGFSEKMAYPIFPV